MAEPLDIRSPAQIAGEEATRNMRERLEELNVGAQLFARTMTQAFALSIASGKQFDDVLKGLMLRLSTMALRAAFKPLESMLTGGINSLLEGLQLSLTGGSLARTATGAVKPFASGGVIGTPTYFPLMAGGVGLAGEAGPEAIMPLARGPDGRLGVAGPGGGATSVIIHIATSDAESFRRSESYVTGQIARAVARGQRSL